MPDVLDEYGGFAKLDVKLNTPWKGFEDIVEEPISDMSFI